MCGFGDKDRRPISPPPILKLLVRTQQGMLLSPQDIDTSFFVVLCDCYDETGMSPANMILHSVPISSSSSAQQQQEHEQQQSIAVPSSSSVASRSSSSTTTTAAVATSSSSATTTTSNTNKTTVKMKNLVGSCIASPSKLYNEQQELGIYFVFHDLSLRSEGRFRLMFSLIDISSPDDSKSVNTKSISHIVTTTTSDVFTAFTAKNFPGVVPPTQLSQCFAKQGVKIPTRRDTKSKRMRKSSETNKDDEQQLQREQPNE
ncbi:velvet factor [Phascolomyces articulosus]|uniref:Velvet factor n=1 Tax=Phascolomyces articulosus TaxID=60185 RepID=A0AAD5K9T6_9FUNG|nr:velvet factor [Phascolomyces articulosus]